MKDINGVEIEVGMTVKSLQPSGGILPPAPAQTGEVTLLKDGRMAIRFKEYNYDFYSYILLDGKINEIVK